MKRVLGLLTGVVCALGVVAFSQATTVDWNWNVYGGGFSGTFTAGDDAQIIFSTDGGHIWGEFHATDANNNPYNYNVDNVNCQVKANVEGGGGVYFKMDRNDSWVPMYGPAGQYTYTDIHTDDGQAYFTTNIRSNYADMITQNYGWQANSQYTASGTNFYINHYICAASGLDASIFVSGNGSADVTLMSDEMRASGWRFGEGAGCYTNAHASGTGSGTFILGAKAPNNITTGWWGPIGGGSLLVTFKYNNGFNITPINMRGN